MDNYCNSQRKPLFLADLIRLIPFTIRLDTIDAATYGESTFPKVETKVMRQFKIDIEDKMCW